MEFREYNVIRNLLEREKLTRQYLKDTQKEITNIDREVFVDWSLGKCVSYNMPPETYHLAIQLLDRDLMKINVSEIKFMLLSLTCLLIVSKYTTIHHFNMSDILGFCENIFNKKDVLDMEIIVLGSVDYRLSVPTVYDFIYRILTEIKASKADYFMSEYFCVMSPYNERICVEFPASMIATSCVYLVFMVTRHVDGDET